MSKGKLIIALWVAAWFACGIVGAGMEVAHLETRWPCKHYRDHLGMGLFVTVMGPVGAFVSLVTTGLAEDGWQLTGSCGDEPKPIALTRKYWACTSTHEFHHKARSGTLTRFGRLSDRPAYTTIECDQWSARMTDGTLGGGAVESKRASEVQE